MNFALIICAVHHLTRIGDTQKRQKKLKYSIERPAVILKCIIVWKNVRYKELNADKMARVFEWYSIRVILRHRKNKCCIIHVRQRVKLCNIY